MFVYSLACAVVVFAIFGPRKEFARDTGVASDAVCQSFYWVKDRPHTLGTRVCMV